MTLNIWVLQNTLAAGCLAIVVAIACRFGRFSPAVRHALWLLVLLKLVTPPLVELPIPRSILGLSPSPTAQPESRGGRTLVRIAAERFYDFSEGDPRLASMPEESAASLGAPALDELPSEIEIDQLFNPARDETQPVVSSRSRSQVSTKAGSAMIGAWIAGWPWNQALLAGWSVGTALFVLIQGRRLFNLRRMKRRGRTDGGFLTALVAHLAAQMRVAPPPVWIVPDLPTPALCAWGRASLLWPEESLTQFTEAGEKAVVLHELAHLRRRDHWVGWLELVTGCLWWWNPLFWFVRHRLNETAELACDSWVVALLPDGRRAYAEALIDVAQGEAPSPLAGVVLGVGDGSRKLMERRLIMIMRGKARYQIPAIGVVLLALVALATIPRWTIGKEPFANDNVVETAESIRLAPSDVDVSGSSFLSAKVEEQLSLDRAAGAFDDATSGPATDLAGSEPDLPIATSAHVTEAASEVAIPALGEPIPTQGTLGPPEQDPFGSVAATQTTVSADSVPPDDRIKHLEAQLSAIQSELTSLRGRKTPTTEVPTPASKPTKNAFAKPKATYQFHPDGKPNAVIALGSDQKHTISEDPSVETVVMTRSTYKLPPGRAVILEKALRELLNDEVEIKVKNDALQITAAEEDQDAIHHLIRLMQRKGREPAKPNDRLDRFEQGDIRKAPLADPTLEPSAPTLPSPDFKPPERK